MILCNTVIPTWHTYMWTGKVRKIDRSQSSDRGFSFLLESAKTHFQEQLARMNYLALRMVKNQLLQGWDIAREYVYVHMITHVWMCIYIYIIKYVHTHTNLHLSIIAQAHSCPHIDQHHTFGSDPPRGHASTDSVDSNETQRWNWWTSRSGWSQGG